MSAEDVLNKLGVEAKLDHCDISSAVSMKPDVIITAENFRSQFEKFSVDPKTAMIYLKNIVSKNEIEEKITPVLQDKGSYLNKKEKRIKTWALSILSSKIF